MQRWLGLALIVSGLGFGASGAMDSAARRESRNVFGYDPTADFLAFDPQYRIKHARFADELRDLQLELARQTGQGRATPCSRQIFLEARWLVFYSAQWDRIERRLRDLRTLLNQPSDPSDAREQVESDGSFDHCSEAWFLKLDSTIEEVEDLEERGLRPKFPLKLLDRIKSPAKLREYLGSVLVSDVRKSGLDNRFELNIAITAIERFIVGHVKHDYRFDPELKKALFEYQDKTWQDPAIGFFGGWYRLADGSIRKTADLSVTFHIVSYRRDSIQRVPEMMRTLLAFKDQEYPFGWREEGQSSNHHNYDVVRVLRVGWPQMDRAQRELARTEMHKMLDYCLAGLKSDGSFDLQDEDTVGSSFLFPVSLLNELGYFRPSLRFWRWKSFPGSMKTADKIEHRIKAMGLTDTESQKVLHRFEEARRERRAWRLGAGIAILMFCRTIWIWFKRRRVRRARNSARSIGELQRDDPL